MDTEQMEKIIKKAGCAFCAGNCGVLVEVEDGKVSRITGNKDHALTLGNVCERVGYGSKWLYHPDQLMRPLKRAGERGEGKWQEVDWEQALDDIAGKLGDIREKFGPESLVVTEIETEDGDIEIKARVLSISNSDAKNGTITLDMLNGQTVDITTDNSTAFEDSSSSDTDDDGSFTLDELTDMDYVEVEVSFDGTSYYAYSIEREDDMKTEVEATVDDYVAGTSITLIGITFSVDGSTIISGTPDVGDEVKVSDNDSDGTADEIEVSD